MTATTLSPEEITRRSRSSFLSSFDTLDAERRRGLTAVYAFCRVVDDAVDEAQDAATGRERLAFWSGELERAVGTEPPRTPVGSALQAAIARFGIDPTHLRAVLEGVAMDLELPPFAELEDLEAYCHRVASAVGLACLPVMGAPGAEEYAEHLGQAMQLTNILRDLSADARRGRVYAPRRWLAEAGVEVDWLSGEGPARAYAEGGPVARLAERLAASSRERFARARRALPRGEDGRRLLPAEVMAAVYQDLLARLERRGGDLRRRRPRVPAWRKAYLAWRTRRRLRKGR